MLGDHRIYFGSQDILDYGESFIPDDISHLAGSSIRQEPLRWALELRRG